MFSFLAALSQQELEKIYELTYKYGWIVSEERQQGQLSDRAYMEKARIEGELEPLIDYGLKELKDAFKFRSMDVINIDKFVTKFYNINKFSQTFSDSILPDLIGNEEKNIKNYIIDFIQNYLRSFDYETFIAYWLPLIDELFGYEDSLGYYINNFVNDFIDTASEDQQIELHDELNFLNETYKSKANEYFISLHENDFFSWLEMQVPREKLIKEFKRYNFIYYAEDGYFDNLITGNVLAQFKDSFYKEVLSNLASIKAGKSSSIAIETLNNINKKSNLADKIIAFQTGLTAAHYTGTMADYLLDTYHAEKFLNQLSSDKYVSKWNKELQQATGIRVGASLHLKSALVLMQSFV